MLAGGFQVRRASVLPAVTRGEVGGPGTPMVMGLVMLGVLVPLGEVVEIRKV